MLRQGVKYSAVVVALVTLLYGRSTSFPPKIEDVPSPKKPEIERLRYFSEINAYDALRVQKLTGKSVVVTIMGEMVDAIHPELSNNVRKQYNSFSRKGSVLEGPDNQAVGSENLGLNDGHGTHIAGTIAAACDGAGIQGIACNAKLDVYNIGAYESADKWPSEGWGNENEFSRLLGAFAASLEHLTKRGASRITTGSFNLEGPALRLAKGGKLYRRTIGDILSIRENDRNVDALIENDILRLEKTSDRGLLKRLMEANDNDEMILLAPLISQTREWEKLIRAVAAYQAKDGVYLVTESNYSFEDRTSVLNALPSLSDKVAPGLWLSIVMVRPTNISEVLKNGPSFEELSARLKRATYLTPLNSCGEMAADYCIVTPSWEILSTMSERTAFQAAGPLYKLDGRLFQVLEGHSMGAPMVAAALALMEENNVRNNYGYTMKDLVRILKDSANRSFKGYDSKKHGRGMLDISAAVNAMKIN